MKDLNKEYYIAFGLHLEKLIASKGKDVMTVASLGKIEPKQVYRALNGEHGISMRTILSLAKGLEVQPKELFDFDFIFDTD
ncbi:hypothetical protein CJ739_1388 [Mariniflexile rhizosphaerae]|uniref:helix-turn-helix domain-containing protein n=1 Tax=unclassified Mariniflexile TaxID=2643887 RepID=UPI000CB07ACF|nr:helix-turn-helix domain-containing protein [Mariniflexile sp. TRM1-10]AXP80477.1 hypothetical protein CJ739_1388 [Mariniflexile sp. TRM1-10]PLB20494.1 MAG: Helix-turn-helix domain protein [Flavobacteriaceae bacterium FS1-H7996/R]